MSRVGSLDWGLRTRGRLRLSDRLSVVAQVIMVRVARRLLSIGARSDAIKDINIDTIRWPDSPIAKRALDECLASSPGFMANHCARTYLWGCLLGQLRGVRYDEELLFVSAMLHDMGLTERGQAKRGELGCFAISGAMYARQFLIDLEWPAKRSQRAADAIALHLNARVPLDCGAEAHCLQAGAACDIVGLGYARIPEAARNQVLARYPRDGFKNDWLTVMDREVTAQQNTRLHFLYERGFRNLIKKAPFAG